MSYRTNIYNYIALYVSAALLSTKCRLSRRLSSGIYQSSGRGTNQGPGQYQSIDNIMQDSYYKT